MAILQQPNLGSMQGQDALQQAIARRQQGGQTISPLSQVPSGEQPSQTPPPGQVAQPQAKPPASESELIVKGLTQRLQAISEVDKAQMAPKPMGGQDGQAG